MKRFICLLVTILFIVPILITDVNGVSYETPFKINEYSYEDIEYLQNQIEEKKTLMAAAHDMADAARALGYEDTHEVIQLAKDEYLTYSQERDALQKIHDELLTKWKEKQNKYPEATKIWEYLKEAGYSDYVCAGILGNIMTEVGSNTLAIQPLLKTTKYYGMCQWSLYYSKVWGLPIEGQCKFLLNTIEYEINTYGKLYQRGMTYEKFITMTDCRQIALCFAKSYERCSANGYKARQDNAVIAYNYFVT